MPYKRRARRRAVPPISLPPLPSPLEQKIADLERRLAQAQLSHRHWLTEARKTRLGLSSDRYGGHYAINGAGTWRGIATQVLAQLRPLQQQLRSSRR